MWPIARLINKIPYIGPSLNWKLLIADYRGKFDLSEENLRDWAILNTFDMLSPKYEYPQFPKTIHDWFRNTDLRDVDIQCDNENIEGIVIVGRGTK